MSKETYKNITEKYSFVKGFNIQPDWGRSGIQIWLNFDAERYEKIIKIGKEKFPSMNTLRIWLSFDAYMEDRKVYLENVKKACDILTREGINIIPIYFNGWVGTPCFGAFTAECVGKSKRPAYIKYLRETVEAIKDSNILMHDIANEPYNDAFGHQGRFSAITDFLLDMTEQLRKIDSRPITIGSQSYYSENKEMCDMDVLAPHEDVITLHPYNQKNKPIEEFEKDFTEILDYLKQFNKPIIITECCWAAPTAEARKPYLESELAVYTKYGVGYLAQGLITSPVADLHPVEESYLEEGLYMAFLDRDFNIRPYHDIFNNDYQMSRN